MKSSLMNELFEKYLSNKLTNEEFLEFQKLVNASTNKELEKMMHTSWEVEKGNKINKDIYTDIKAEIDKTNKFTIKLANQTAFRKSMRLVAAILIPAILITSYLYFNTISKTPLNDMVVTVAEGEKATITLPDGTKANLNAETTISYDTYNFNKKDRRVTLKGEAYFQVAHNKNKPFIIKTSHMDVMVLGTTFNLSARDDNKLTELDLKEGKVSISSNLNNKEVILYPNQKAILDNHTGTISVVRSNPDQASAWTKGEMVFHGMEVKNIFREIERSYGVKIYARCPDSIMNDLFTGTFSSGNLDETLRILKMHYKFHYTIDGRNVRINLP